MTLDEAATHARVESYVIEDAIAAGDIRTDSTGSIHASALDLWRQASLARQLRNNVVQLSA